MKNSKNYKINIVFSSFLVIAYIICTYFFSSLAATVSDTLRTVIQILIGVVFGLLLFYATRVGEGKQVRRFSLAVLLVVVLPSLFIVLAGAIEPLHQAVASKIELFDAAGCPSILYTLACVALGYGIPYTFFSGYELRVDDEEAEAPAEPVKPLEGGLAEELAESEIEEASEILAEASEADAAADDTAEETADAAEKAAEDTEAEAGPADEEE